MVTAADLTVMDSDELTDRLAEYRKELFNLRFQLATGQLDNTARMGQVRKDVARILTVLRDREIREAEGTFEPPAGGWRRSRAAAEDEFDDEFDDEADAAEDEEEDA